MVARIVKFARITKNLFKNLSGKISGKVRRGASKNANSQKGLQIYNNTPSIWLGNIKPNYIPIISSNNHVGLKWGCGIVGASILGLGAMFAMRTCQTGSNTDMAVEAETSGEPVDESPTPATAQASDSTSIQQPVTEQPVSDSTSTAQSPVTDTLSTTPATDTVGAQSPQDTAPVQDSTPVQLNQDTAQSQPAEQAEQTKQAEQVEQSQQTPQVEQTEQTEQVEQSQETPQAVSNSNNIFGGEINGITQTSYTIVKGDCLWNIAKKFLQDANPNKTITNAQILKQVHEFGRLNPSIENPDLIYPKDTLKLTA